MNLWNRMLVSVGTNTWCKLKPIIVYLELPDQQFEPNEAVLKRVLATWFEFFKSSCSQKYLNSFALSYNFMVVLLLRYDKNYLLYSERNASEWSKRVLWTSLFNLHELWLSCRKVETFQVVSEVAYALWHLALGIIYASCAVTKMSLIISLKFIWHLQRLFLLCSHYSCRAVIVISCNL